jgi:hypothetical protein
MDFDLIFSIESIMSIVSTLSAPKLHPKLTNLNGKGDSPITNPKISNLFSYSGAVKFSGQVTIV